MYPEMNHDAFVSQSYIQPDNRSVAELTQQAGLTVYNLQCEV